MRAVIKVYAIAAMVALASFAHAETVLHGPIAFTNSIPFEIPHFSSTSGYLRSITLTVTNCSLGMSIIVDNDSTNSVDLNAIYNNSFRLFQSVINYQKGPFAADLFSYGIQLEGTFAATNDGDGPSVRDGGEDELTFDVLHTNISSRSIMTSATDLARCTDEGNITLTIDRWFAIPFIQMGTAMPLDIFTTNITCIGDLYVEYDFEQIPLEPMISGFSVTNGMLDVEINNLSVASSNILQRCFDLRSNEWYDVQSFVSGSSVARRTLENSNQYGRVFYRVLSR